MIASIISIISLVIGFGLSQFGDYFKEKKVDNKKYNRLLFNMLELRHLVLVELSSKKSSNKFIECFEIKIRKLIDSGMYVDFEAPKEELDKVYNTMREVLLKQINTENDDLSKFENIEIKISSIITEISETNPVLAFYLMGGHMISDKLTYEEIDFKPYGYNPKELINIKQFHRQNSSEAFIIKIEQHIKDVLEKGDKKTKKEVQEILSNKKQDIDVEEINTYIDKYLNEVTKELTLKV